MTNAEYNFVNEYEKICKKYDMRISFETEEDFEIPKLVEIKHEGELDNHIGTLLNE